MPHPADDDYENEPFSSPCSAPPLQIVPDAQVQTPAAPAAPSPGGGWVSETAAHEEVALPDVNAPADETVATQQSNVAPYGNVVTMPPAQQAPAPFSAAQKNFERQAEDSFRMALGSNAQTMGEVYNAATEAYANVSEALRASAEGFAAGLVQLNMKLFEFGRANAQSNLAYMVDVSGVRSLRDLVDIQTAYMRGRYDTLTSQARELHLLTTELAGKTAAPLNEQARRAAQLPRIC